MAFLAAAAPFISAGSQIVSGLFQGRVARNNAKVALQNADYARQAGQEQAAIGSRKGAAQVAGLKSGFAAAGVDVNTGSAADVQAGARETSTLDVETILNNAELEAYGYTTRAASEKAQASQDELGGFLGAAGTLVGNAPSLGWKWSRQSEEPDLPSATGTGALY